MDYKICTCCGIELPNTDEYFYFKNKSKPEMGFVSQCKECLRQKSREWIRKHPEEKKRANQKYFANPPDFLKTWWRNHSKEQRQSGYHKNWIANNQDKVKEYRNRHHNHKISENEYQNMLDVFNRSCAYCGMTETEHMEKFHERLHRDHVDHNGSDDLSNCVPACKICNSLKHQYDMSSWYFKQLFFDQQKYEKILWWIETGYKEQSND